MNIEYRVRPVTRYQVTRYYADGTSGCCESKGMFDNGEVAYQVAYALAKDEAERLKLLPGDERIVFPNIPADVSVPPCELVTSTLSRKRSET